MDEFGIFFVNHSLQLAQREPPLEICQSPVEELALSKSNANKTLSEADTVSFSTASLSSIVISMESSEQTTRRSSAER